MDTKAPLPLFERAIAALLADPGGAFAEDWASLDRQLAQTVFVRLAGRRRLRPGDNVNFFKSTGGIGPSPRDDLRVVNPRGSSSSIPPRLQERLATRPKPTQCEVCEEAGTICYEHDHATGHFRGWLCTRCNTALGFASDSPERLRKLALYLESHRAVAASLPAMPEVLPRKHRLAPEPAPRRRYRRKPKHLMAQPAVNNQ
jgi:hypothetical protein